MPERTASLRHSPLRPLSPIQASSGFTLYRCTKFVTYTASSVFAMGYAFFAVLAPPRVADSRVPKPWRKADRGRTVCARPVS